MTTQQNQPLTPERAAALIAANTEEIRSPDLCENPLVSVCLITYNHAKYIRQALDSVYAQETDFPIEVVIGDDCSTDGTTETVLEYQRRYPEKTRVLLAKENLGQHTGNGRLNFVRTLQACRGEYVALLEGDDYWTNPEKLQKQVEFLEEQPEYVMCFGNTTILRDATGETCPAFLNPASEITHEELVRCRHFDRGAKLQGLGHTSTVMFRKSALSILPDFYYRHQSGDLMLYMILGSQGKTRFIDEQLSVYRKHGGGISERSVATGVDLYLDRIQMYWKMNEFFQGEQRKVIRSVVAQFHGKLHDVYWAERRLLLAMRHRLAAARCNGNVSGEFVRVAWHGLLWSVRVCRAMVGRITAMFRKGAS